MRPVGERQENRNLHHTQTVPERLAARWLFVCILAAALVLSAAACGRKRPPSETESTGPETKTEESAELSLTPETSETKETEEGKPTDSPLETVAPFPGTNPEGAKAPGVRILIATDIHYLAEELTDNSDTFKQMVAHGDGKVTQYIRELTESFTEEVLRERPDLLLLLGDLTYNGERQSHEELAGYLKRIEAAGIPVAVIPGNHDLNNAAASGYLKGSRTPAEKTSPGQFASIYGDFGYQEAISRDPESLSYVYPISDKIWGLFLDTCQYEGTNLVGGMIDLDTYDWIEKQLDEAFNAGVMLLPVSHHNLLEESEIYVDDCTIEHSERLVELLNGWGAPLYLSGHLHVQHYANSDTTGGDTGIYEIVTSSLATPKCQYGDLYFQEDGHFSYETRQVDLEGWAKTNRVTDQNLQNFDRYREEFLAQVFYNQAHDNLSVRRDVELTADQIHRMSETYAKANSYYYWGRALEVAEEILNSPEYTLWEDNGNGSLQAQYLDYILEEATVDYNRLEQ